VRTLTIVASLDWWIGLVSLEVMAVCAKVSKSLKVFYLKSYLRQSQQISQSLKDFGLLRGLLKYK
jgi:hypothetical protein